MDVLELQSELGLGPVVAVAPAAAVAATATPPARMRVLDDDPRWRHLAPHDPPYRPDADRRIRKAHPLDVICGRGRPFQVHPGNIRFLNIVDLFRGRYARVPRREKSVVAAEISEAIRAKDVRHRVRFLRYVENDDEEYWEELTQSEELDKISHALRAKVRAPGRVREQTKRLKEAMRQHSDRNGIGPAAVSLPAPPMEDDNSTSTGTAAAATVPSAAFAAATVQSAASMPAPQESSTQFEQQAPQINVGLGHTSSLIERRLAEQQREILRLQQSLSTDFDTAMGRNAPFVPQVGINRFQPGSSLPLPSTGTPGLLSSIPTHSGQPLPSALGQLNRHIHDRHMNELLLAENLSLQRQLETNRQLEMSLQFEASRRLSVARLPVAVPLMPPSRVGFPTNLGALSTRAQPYGALHLPMEFPANVAPVYPTQQNDLNGYLR